jgi:hypothetical protein
MFSERYELGLSQKAAFFIVTVFACSVPDCWLEVSLHPEGPAIGQLDQGFPWFALVPEQMLSWYPNFTLLCILHMQPSQ